MLLLFIATLASAWANYPNPVAAPAAVDFYKGFWTIDQSASSLYADTTGQDLLDHGVNIVVENMFLCAKQDYTVTYLTPSKATMRQRIRGHHTNGLHVMLVNDVVYDAANNSCATGSESGVSATYAANTTFQNNLGDKIRDMANLAKAEHVTLYSMLNEADVKLGDATLASDFLQTWRATLRSSAYPSGNLLIWNVGHTAHIGDIDFTDFDKAGFSITPMAVGTSGCSTFSYTPDTLPAYLAKLEDGIADLKAAVDSSTEVFVTSLGVWGNAGCSPWGNDDPGTGGTANIFFGESYEDIFNLYDAETTHQIEGVITWEGRSTVTFSGPTDAEVFVSGSAGLKTIMQDYYLNVFP